MKTTTPAQRPPNRAQRQAAQHAAWAAAPPKNRLAWLATPNRGIKRPMRHLEALQKNHQLSFETLTIARRAANRGLGHIVTAIARQAYARVAMEA